MKRENEEGEEGARKKEGEKEGLSESENESESEREEKHECTANIQPQQSLTSH